MKKLILLAALASLAACDNSMTAPAAAHDCNSMNLKPGSAAYNDCMKRMAPENGALHNEQTNP